MVTKFTSIKQQNKILAEYPWVGIWTICEKHVFWVKLVCKKSNLDDIDTQLKSESLINESMELHHHV